LNKKLIYIFAVLVVGLFVVSACQQEVGRKINREIDIDYEEVEEVNEQVVLNRSDYTGGDVRNITYYLNITNNPPIHNSGYVRLFRVDGRQIGGLNPIPFPSNTRVILRAISTGNWTFSNWTGDLTGNNANITIVMNRNKNIIANFRRR